MPSHPGNEQELDTMGTFGKICIEQLFASFCPRDPFRVLERFSISNVGELHRLRREQRLKEVV